MTETLTIRSVNGDGIRINDELYSDAVALTPQEIIGAWEQKPVAELVENDFAPLLELSPELVILGTGERSEFLPRDLVFAFARRGTGLEAMDTAAAARTFNVLAGEGRLVAAVLYSQ